MNTAKSFGWFVLKVLLAMIVINAILSFVGVKLSAYVTNPVGSVKALFTKSATPTATGA